MVAEKQRSEGESLLREVSAETAMGLIAIIVWPWKAAWGFVLSVLRLWLYVILLPFRALLAVYK